MLSDKMLERRHEDEVPMWRAYLNELEDWATEVKALEAKVDKYHEEVKLKDRLILSFGDVKICLIELEERIEQIERNKEIVNLEIRLDEAKKHCLGLARSIEEGASQDQFAAVQSLEAWLTKYFSN